MQAYTIEVELSQQEDGLWRATVPDLDGCFVDAPTIAEAVADIQSAAAMFIDVYREQSRALPPSVGALDGPTIKGRLPVAIDEHAIKKPRRRASTAR